MLNRMVYDFEDQLDAVFHALADRTRRNMLERLAEHDLGIAELSMSYNMSLVAVSKHVKVLEKAGLIAATKEGRITRCAMQFGPLEPASQQIALYKQFWREEVGQMDKYVQRVKWHQARKSSRRKENRRTNTKVNDNASASGEASGETRVEEQQDNGKSATRPTDIKSPH